MLTLLLALAAGQTYTPDLSLQPDPVPRPRQYRSDGPPRTSRLGQSSYAFFEAFPADGAGTKGVCSTTAPTSATGAALTFTRASSAMCTKTAAGGLATTGIANGDLVLLSNNQPRVEYDSAGTLGLHTETTSRTNLLLRSEEIDNAAWTKGPSVGTITANFATAPDGTLTADRYQYTNSNNDYVLQGWAVSGVAASGSVYLKGTSGAGTINLCRGGAGSQCVTCSYVAATWSRCVYAATLVSSNNLFIGCETSTLGAACAQTGLDVLVWGFDGEVGAYPTSYKPTTSATATRAAEVATFPVSLSTGVDFSFAESFVSPSNVSACAGFFSVNTSASGPVIYKCFTTTNVFRVQSGGVSADSTGPAFTANKWQTGVRWGGSWNRASSVVTAYTDGVAGTPSAATPTVTSTSWSAVALQSDGIHTRICADPSATRCR